MIKEEIIEKTKEDEFLKYYIMIEGFIYRLFISNYKYNFVLGMEIFCMIMKYIGNIEDKIIYYKGNKINKEEYINIIKEVCNIKCNDEFTYKFKSINYLDNYIVNIEVYYKEEYFGLLDFEIKEEKKYIKNHKYNFKSNIFNRDMFLISYFPETFIALEYEKIMNGCFILKDFYYIDFLLNIRYYDCRVNYNKLQEAIFRVCEINNSFMSVSNYKNIIEAINNNYELRSSWKIFRHENKYAFNIQFYNIITDLEKIGEIFSRSFKVII